MARFGHPLSSFGLHGGGRPTDCSLVGALWYAHASMRSPSTATAIALALATLAASGSAFAEEPAKKAAASAAPTGAAPATAGRKDPRGITGVSPYTEAIAKGHALIAARDLAGGISAYQDAISQDPNNPIGHYFLGAARIMKNEFGEGQTSLESAIRFAGKNDEIQAKALFQIADIKERQDKLDEAKKAWDAYIQFVDGHQKAHGYSQNGAERMKVAEKRLAIVKSSLEVKARIEQRLKEVGAPPPDDGPQGPGGGKKK